MRKKAFIGKVPAHLIEEAVGFCHSVKLMLVLLQKIHIALLWDKLQQLLKQEKTVYLTYLKLIRLYYFISYRRLEDLSCCKSVKAFFHMLVDEQD